MQKIWGYGKLTYHRVNLKCVFRYKVMSIGEDYSQFLELLVVLVLFEMTRTISVSK